MTLFLAAVSRWFFAGGWKIVGIVAALFGVWLFWRHYESISQQAALVPTLQGQISDMNTRADHVADLMAAAEQKRGAAEAELSAWQSFKNSTVDPIKEQGRHVAASTNPVCLPSDADRSLRNDALKRLLGVGSVGGTGVVPDSTGTVH